VRFIVEVRKDGVWKQYGVFDYPDIHKLLDRFKEGFVPGVCIHDIRARVEPSSTNGGRK